MTEMPYVTRTVDGELVLHDPAALAMLQAVAKVNCRATFEANRDRIEHFVNRIDARGMTPDDVMIVVINVDTQIGRPIADGLMPGHDWQPTRDAGQIPFARGLAGRPDLQELLELIDSDEAAKLKKAVGRVAVLVVDHDVVAVFDMRGVKL